jgi:CRP-like cAMP-binding protein
MRNGLEHGNLLLSAIQHELPGRVAPVELHVGELLSLAGSSASDAYFPAGSIVCWIGQSRDGHRVELAIVGREGMAGIAALFSEMPPAWDLEVQVSGPAYRVDVAALKRLFEISANARHVLLAFGAYLLAQTGQSCICLAAHSAENRLARWLLAAQRELQVDYLPLSQESLSEMIGVRRPTLALVAGKMQKAGLLTLGRTRVRIMDREALTRLACECHHLSNTYLERYTNLLRRAVPTR